LLQLGVLTYQNSTWRLKNNDDALRTAEEAVEMEVIKNVKKCADPRGVTGGTATITNLKDVAQRRLNEESKRTKGLVTILQHDILQIVLELPRPLHVKEGQYIGIWTHKLGMLSGLQVHPFMITSWSEGKTNKLRLLVEPRNGWTKKLLRYSDTPWRALFSGPYGVSVPTRDYAVVLLVASGLGLVAQIPYLKRLIHDHNARRTRARRIHLVWQLKTPGRVHQPFIKGYFLTGADLAFIFENILNETLYEDTLDDGRVSFATP